MRAKRIRPPTEGWKRRNVAEGRAHLSSTLPTLQIAWDSTSLKDLICPRKYYYQMIEGWRPKGESVHLKFGIHYHDALELYDKCRAGVVERERTIRRDGIEYDVEAAMRRIRDAGLPAYLATRLQWGE